MRLRILALLSLTLLPKITLANDAQTAKQIVVEQRVEELEWRQKMLKAQTPQEKLSLLEIRPDNEAYGKRMVAAIASSLNQAWSMEYIIWLLRHHPTLSAKGTINLTKYIEQYHAGSPELGKFCLALVDAGNSDPQATASNHLVQKKIAFLESIVDSDKSKVVRGQASLALSGILGQLGDSSSINRRRLDLIRVSIIHAADTDIDGIPLADIAKEEIYKMTKLSKGVQAPMLVGKDSNGLPLKLSNFAGKVIVLVFWNSWEQAPDTIKFLNKLHQTYQRQPVQIVGVNRDQAATLRKFLQETPVAGVHFSDPEGQLSYQYRIQATPSCYLIDQQGYIQYSGQLGSFVDLTVSALLAPNPEKK
ncbi:peroxiredoxin family protein [Rubritalea marina]|uniref:peroxiredoxin family protein n=1 Tax=Rubritalea marina TaxID=361055 RepID=UPI00036DD2C1|nr:TlpA disulfide reductase family protein [Rubritalea marina]